LQANLQPLAGSRSAGIFSGKIMDSITNYEIKERALLGSLVIYADELAQCAPMYVTKGTPCAVHEVHARFQLRLKDLLAHWEKNPDMILPSRQKLELVKSLIIQTNGIVTDAIKEITDQTSKEVLAELEGAIKC
jgi:hypothetical protein